MQPIKRQDFENEFLPYGRQSVGPEELTALQQVLDSNWLTTGPFLKRFEQEFADYLGVAHAVAVNSGTAALQAAMWAAGLGPGDEVITTANTFCATSNAALMVGAKPVFADLDLDTFNIDPQSVRQCITPRTKAVVMVHFAGYPCDVEALRTICDEHQLILIEDACHALGASLPLNGEQTKIGATADLSTFSFHPVKNITTGEGGMVTTPHAHYAQRLELIRQHGLERDSNAWTVEHPHQGPWGYEMQCWGHNFRMSELQAALGCVQLQRWPQMQTIRDDLAATYNALLAHHPDIILPNTEQESIQHGRHLFVVRFKGEAPQTRAKVFQGLRQHKIGAMVHYIPVYRHAFYQQLGYNRTHEDCPRTEQYAATCLSLPLFPAMTERAVKRVVQALDEIFQDLPQQLHS